MTACPQSVYTPTRLQVALHENAKKLQLGQREDEDCFESAMKSV